MGTKGVGITVTTEANLNLTKQIIGRRAGSFYEEHLQLPDGSIDEEIVAIVSIAEKPRGSLRIAGNSSCDGFVLSLSTPKLHDFGEYGQIVLSPVRWRESVNVDNVFITAAEVKTKDEGQTISIALSDGSRWDITNFGDVIRLVRAPSEP